MKLDRIGFSFFGFAYLLLLFVPNLLWLRFRREDPRDRAVRENRFLLACERIGQVSTTTCAAIFHDLSPAQTAGWAWLSVSLLAMVLYEIAWVRYFLGSRQMGELYRNLWGVPIPLAALPVLGFLFLAIYERNGWLLASVVLLGLGHIGIHLQHRRSLVSSVWIYAMRDI